MSGARIGRGSLTGSTELRRDDRPGLRGAITLETDLILKAGQHVYLTGWIRQAAGVPFISIVVEQGDGGGRLRSKPVPATGQDDAA